MAIRQTAHTAFAVADIQKSLDYYCGGLGLEKIFELTLSDGRKIQYLKICDRQFIELFYGGNNPKAIIQSRDGSYEHLCLEVTQINELYDDLVKKGIPVDGKPVLGMDGNYQLWSTDPDGNRIEFMEYGSDTMQLKY